MAPNRIGTSHCPITRVQDQHILLAHGGGGRLMNQLIETLIQPTFDNPIIQQRHDGAVFAIGDSRLAFTTDSYVVQPLFFPGGDIGSLAVFGTVNDLAMCAAKPLYLSTSFILEEGFKLDQFEQIVRSIREAADQAGVKIITGDTKVVESGKADGIFINTAGVGLVRYPINVGAHQIQANDLIVLSGDIGRHGVAILAAREGFSFEAPFASDSAPLNHCILDLIQQAIEIHCLRDLTRGGLATALVELSETGNVRFRIDESAIPVREEIRGACEILGFDPLYLANEGRFIAFIPSYCVEKALEIVNEHSPGRNATIIGRVISATQQGVILKTQIGTTRILDMQSGEQLPRIC
ncbi:hydrogenase expression/formation protein HypE [bacterium]|nr:hydrogenase expression/formation protein HypE [bacterium]